MTAQNPSDFTIRFNHKFFLDTNVWIYLVFPGYSNINGKIIQKYSDFFKSIKDKKCLVCTNMIQMSEMVNVILREEYSQFRKTNHRVSFKDFRGTDEGGKALENAKTITQVVLKATNFESGIFNNAQMEEMVGQCDKADLNDIYFAKYCQDRDALMVTHDYDFMAIEGTLKVLSFNSNYH